MQNIATPSTSIACHHSRWKLNRDFIAGEYAVKSITAGYLPRLPVHDPFAFPNANEAYCGYLNRTNFFPASARILDGIKGMIFRKLPHFKCATSLQSVFNTITADGCNVFDLAETVVSEVMATNFVGLYVDYPSIPAGTSQAEMERLNHRPFITLYPAESILEVTTSVIANVQTITRVRLMDNAETIRELVLKDGVYMIVIHDHVNGQWLPREPIIPAKNNKPINRIPFVLVSTKARTTKPSKAVMDDICLLNKQLFQAQANAGNSLYYCANPILVFKGVAQTDIKMSAGTILFFEGHTSETPVDVEYVEYKGTAQSALDDAVATLKDELKAVGGRIISPDGKTGVESAEALNLQRDSENSVLASHSKTISRAIREALQIVADWLGSAEPVEFELNTDFNPQALSAQERAQIVAEWMAGLYTHETALGMLIDGEILPDSFDIEGEIERVSSEQLSKDKPSAF